MHPLVDSKYRGYRIAHRHANVKGWRIVTLGNRT